MRLSEPLVPKTSGIPRLYSLLEEKGDDFMLFVGIVCGLIIGGIAGGLSSLTA